MNEETLNACIKELAKVQRGLNILADKRLMDTGKGDFLLDGQVLGLNLAIAVLEDLKSGEGDAVL